MVVTKYINTLDSLYTEHRIYDRIDALVDRFAHAQSHDPPKLITKFGALGMEK